MTDTIQSVTQIEVPTYPPAPWDLAGQLWVGLFRLDRGAVPIPPEATRVLGAGWLTLLFVRYLEGTLRYDELVFGTMISYRGRQAIWVDRIWVDSEQSLWGGRRLWGVPKEMARFAWQGNQVSVSDEAGNIATLTLNRAPARLLPPLSFAAPGLGQVDGRWVEAVGAFQGRIGWSGLRIERWTDRFPYRPYANPLFTVGVKPFALHLPAAIPVT